MHDFTLRGVYPIRRKYEYSHMIRKMDSVEIPVDAKLFVATCATAITNSFETAKYKVFPESFWRPMLEEFISDVVIASRLDFAVSIGAFAVIERENHALLRRRPSCEGYVAKDIEDACRLFLGAYMASAMMLTIGTAEVHDTSFWDAVTSGVYSKEDLWEMEMLFADSVREVRVGGLVWNEIQASMMLVHGEHIQKMKYLPLVERHAEWLEEFLVHDQLTPDEPTPRDAHHSSGAIVPVSVLERAQRGEWLSDAELMAVQRAQRVAFFYAQYEELVSQW